MIIINYIYIYIYLSSCRICKNVPPGRQPGETSANLTGIKKHMFRVNFPKQPCEHALPAQVEECIPRPLAMPQVPGISVVLPWRLGTKRPFRSGTMAGVQTVAICNTQRSGFIVMYLNVKNK